MPIQIPCSALLLNFCRQVEASLHVATKIGSNLVTIAAANIHDSWTHEPDQTTCLRETISDTFVPIGLLPP